LIIPYPLPIAQVGARLGDQNKNKGELPMPRFLFRLALLAILSGIAVPMAAPETIGGAKASGFSTHFVKPVALRYLVWKPQGKAPKGAGHW